MDDQKDTTEIEKTVSENNLNSFVAELIHLQDDKLMTVQDLENLHVKYRLSQDEINKLQMLIDRHLSRAADYTNRERWDNAIVETERALLFSPLDNDIRLDLAELFLKRSTKYGYLQKDLNRAEHEVRDALFLEPENSEAKNFQKELKDLRKMLQGRQNNRMFIPLFLILILILGIALFPRIRDRFHFLSLQRQDAGSSAVIPAPRWTTKEAAVTTSDSLSENFEFSLTEATLVRESPAGSPALRISGYMEPTSDDYSLIELELMPDSSIATGVSLPVVDRNDAPLRRGETKSFSSYFYLKNIPEEYESLYITVKSSQKYYEEKEVLWQEIEYDKVNPLPQGVFLTLESRFYDQLEGYDRNYLFYDLRLTNRSITELTVLDLICSWSDGDGRIISSQPLSLVESSAVPVKPQSMQSYRLMFDLPKRAGMDDGELSVTLEKAEKE